MELQKKKHQILVPTFVQPLFISQVIPVMLVPLLHFSLFCLRCVYSTTALVSLLLLKRSFPFIIGYITGCNRNNPCKWRLNFWNNLYTYRTGRFSGLPSFWLQALSPIFFTLPFLPNSTPNKNHQSPFNRSFSIYQKMYKNWAPPGIAINKGKTMIISDHFQTPPKDPNRRTAYNSHQLTRGSTSGRTIPGASPTRAAPPAKIPSRRKRRCWTVAAVRPMRSNAPRNGPGGGSVAGDGWRMGKTGQHLVFFLAFVGVLWCFNDTVMMIL